MSPDTVHSTTTGNPDKQLRTASLTRRVVLYSLLVLLVVLGAAGILTDVLLGSQLRADAAARLNSKVEQAQAALTSGARPQEVVAAARGDGVTASLLDEDGTVVGNTDLVPTPPAPGGPAPTPAGGPPQTPTASSSTQELTSRLSDGSLLTVAVDTAQIDNVRAQLRSVLIPLLTGALLLAAVLLLIATRTALRPLDRMTSLARSISHGQRGRRLNPGRTNTELGRTAAAFDDMLDALEGAERTAVESELRTRRFVADAAHELRTPIAGVSAAAEALIGADPGADPELRDRMQVLVVREAIRAGRLVDDLLSLATIESGLQLQREPVDLLTLLHAQADRIRVLSPGLEVRVDGMPCSVHADPLRLTQVMTNLLENARRYAGRPGRVAVELRADPTEVRVLVVDDGPGVPVADRERIFDRLVRLDQARTSPGDQGSPAGFGLGLAIARGIARAHGGDLSCIEPPGSWPGAAFLLRLPIGQPSDGW